jgi:hypothetical protein
LLEISRLRSIVAIQSKYTNQCEKATERKWKQYKSKEGNEKARLARQRSWNKKKIECEIIKNEIKRLKEKVKELKRKVKKYKKS